jgi:hypothetical protein
MKIGRLRCRFAVFSGTAKRLASHHLIDAAIGAVESLSPADMTGVCLGAGSAIRRIDRNGIDQQGAWTDANSLHQ